MRYRPFGASGVAASAISVLLRERPGLDGGRIVLGAFECGVNAFELVAGAPVLTQAVGEAWRAVERRLLVIGLRVGGVLGEPLGAERLSGLVREHLGQGGLDYLDYLNLDEAAFASLTSDAIRLLGDLRAVGLCRQIGVVGGGDDLDGCIGSNLFEVFASPFNLTSDSRVRRRIRAAVEADMAVICYDATPDVLCRPQQAATRPKLSLIGRPIHPLAGAGTYSFLQATKGWSAEELCIGYALTEPSFATIQIEAAGLEELERYAAVPDRDLPTGVAAQIEMARFAPPPIAQRA